MSIYATWLTIEDARQVAERMASHGINYGVIGVDGPLDIDTDLEPDDYDAPIVYQGSHVLPCDSDRRGGSVSLAAIPDHVTRDGQDNGAEGEHKPWVRLDVMEHPSTYGEPQEGYSTVVLTRAQVERLRDTMTAWLDADEVA